MHGLTNLKIVILCPFFLSDPVGGFQSKAVGGAYLHMIRKQIY